MKKILPLFLSVMLMLTGCTVSLSETGVTRMTTHAATATGSDTKSYLVLGDSIAAHYGVSDREGYDHKLENKLRSSGEKWIGDNWGVDGYTSGNLVTLLDKSMRDPKRRSVIENADLICISIGGNNILKYLREHGVANLPPNTTTGWGGLLKALADGSDVMVVEYLADLEVIMNTIRRANPDAVVLVQNIHNVARDAGDEVNLFGITTSIPAIIEPFFTPLLKAIDENAERLGYYVADTYSAFRDSPERQLLRREMIHPNAEGHTVISEVLYRTYQKAIGRREN